MKKRKKRAIKRKGKKKTISRGSVDIFGCRNTIQKPAEKCPIFQLHGKRQSVTCIHTEPMFWYTQQSIHQPTHLIKSKWIFKGQTSTAEGFLLQLRVWPLRFGSAFMLSFCLNNNEKTLIKDTRKQTILLLIACTTSNIFLHG